MTGCGDGAATPPRQLAGEFESEHGSDLEQAVRYYREGKHELGAATLRKLAADPDWHVRVRAIHAIGDVQDPALLPEVHRALEDPLLELRETASRVLQWSGNKTSMPPLRRALADPEGIVRSNSAEALARIGGADALSSLETLLRDDQDPGVRALTVAALAWIQDPAAVPVLVAALDDPSALVRARAVETLRDLGFDEARPALERVSASDPDEGVRAAAATALARLRPATGGSNRP